MSLVVVVEVFVLSHTSFQGLAGMWNSHLELFFIMNKSNFVIKCV